MSEHYTQWESDALTPTQRLAAKIKDLEARIELLQEELFYKSAKIAHLEVQQTKQPTP